VSDGDPPVLSQPGLSQPVLSVFGLRKEFNIRNGGAHATLTAVDNVDLSVSAGETVGLVGESGSGKSVLARCIARLVEPTGGEVRLAGVTLSSLRSSELAKAYRDLQMVFQDPNSSLNPRMTVRQVIEEPLRVHFHLGRAAREERALQLLADVDLSSELLSRYPRQLSGGQRQRVGIARALAVRPRVVLLDEPTASLDVSVRGQILRLLARIQAEQDIGYLFISHDLEVVRYFAHRVMVMYLGTVVEQGPTAEIFAHPAHPYTRALLSAAPVAEHGRVKKRLLLSGEIPSPINLPTGCRLASRCPLVQPSCTASVPPLAPVAPGHLSACPVTSPAHQRPDEERVSLAAC
jgi:oligopeptide/dipeptide ABC transporter ATP-binding protein